MPDVNPSATPPKARHWPTALTMSVAIRDDGLVFGAGSILARMTGRAGGVQHLALDADRARVLALLSVAYRRPVSTDVLRHIEAASSHWQHGDKALANLRLVFAGLPKLKDSTDAARLRLAEYCLDEGLSPHNLMTELGLDPSVLGKYGYDPNEPRDGRGRWTRDGDYGRQTSRVRPDGTIVVAGNDRDRPIGVPLKESAVEDEPAKGGEEPTVVEIFPLVLPLLPHPGGGLPIEPPVETPIVPGGGASTPAAGVPVSIEISVSRFGEAAQHILDAQAAGHPSILTIDRDGADANRHAATGRLPKVPGMHLDEYPPAMFREGGASASVRPIDPSNNRSAGSYIGSMCRPFPDGSQIKLKVVQ